MEEAALKLLLAKGPLPAVSHPVIGRTLLPAQYLLSKILAKHPHPNYSNNFLGSLVLRESQSDRHKKGKVDIQVTMIIASLAKGFSAGWRALKFSS